MTDRPAANLRARGEALAAPLPPLLARAERLVASVHTGGHGRRRAGAGDVFWQYRPAQPHEARQIDWRRSAKGDQPYVQEREWQIAQSVSLTMLGGPELDFGTPDTKRVRMADLAAALSMLLLRGGERVGLGALAPARGEAQLLRICQALTGDPDLPSQLPPAAGAGVIVGDFLGDLTSLDQVLEGACARGAPGVILQVLAAEEAAFPYRGRTRFVGAGADAATHETQSARALRPAYLARLAERQAALAQRAALAGWRFGVHHTGQDPAEGLIWLWRMLGARA